MCKKFFAFLFFFLSYEIEVLACSAAPTSSTVFKPQSISSALSLETALHDMKVSYRVIDAPIGGAGARRPWLYTDWSIFYFQSFDATAQTQDFMPNNLVTLICGQNNTSNLSTPWIGVVSPLTNPFKSEISFNPFRQVMGSTFKMLIDFGGVFPDIDTALKDMWLSLYMPLTHVRHNLGITEKVISGQGVSSGFENVMQALNSPLYAFCKLSPNTLTATRMDDMQLRVGWNFYKSKKVSATVYGVTFIPLGRRPTAEYLFEPTIGLAGHWAPGLGLITNFIFYEPPGATMSLIGEFRWNYIMNSMERRTPDLVNGDWSRYVLVCDIDDLLYPIPGVNFLTRDLSVTPRNMVDFLLAINYRRDQLTLEVGYDLWYRQKEKVTLSASSQPIAFAVETVTTTQPLQAVIYAITGCCPKTSLSNATICQATPGPGAVPSDAIPIAITNQDLNLSSATKPSVIYMKLYGGCSWAAKERPASVGACASVEIIAPKGSLKQWGVWLKAAYAF